MQKRFLALWMCLMVLSFASFATQTKHTASKKSATSKSTSGKMATISSGPDKKYMQQIWDGWSTLDPSHVAQFYAPGTHTFFDVAPLKYNNWDEYSTGAKKLLSVYKNMVLTVNDDAVVHSHGDSAWGTATVKMDATTKAGKHEMATIRWTVIWEKQEGKWLIVHEHVSEPLQ
jgi:ketosteroid isomerase-like protein